MTQIANYKNSLKLIEKKENELISFEPLTIEKSLEMIQFLKKTLTDIKTELLLIGFENSNEEVFFFKNIKPIILGKLIFYNKIYRIETNCPINAFNKNEYYLEKISELNKEYEKYFRNNDFYKYYQANRVDRDLEYFTLGQINLLVGINSFAFEIDPLFSTYYDYKLARILANTHLINYLQEQISYSNEPKINYVKNNESLTWSESQNALIELIYALYVSGSINNGKSDIKKIAVLFQQLFGISLNDIHHAFHRMKSRAKSRTIYLDRLKETLEDYMNNSL